MRMKQMDAEEAVCILMTPYALHMLNDSATAYKCPAMTALDPGTSVIQRGHVTPTSRPKWTQQD